MRKEGTGLYLNQQEISLPKGLESILPPICQEGIRGVLGRLQRMEKEKLWLKHRTPEELNLLLPKVAPISQEVYAGLKPFKKRLSSWLDARDAAWHAAKDAALGADRNAVLGATKDVASDAALGGAWKADWNGAWDSALGVARGAACEVVKDQPGLERNPFLPLLSLYELGAARINFRKVDGKEKLVVDFPLQLQHKTVLGCLVFGEDGSYDQKVFYVHGWEEGCSAIQPLKGRRIIE